MRLFSPCQRCDRKWHGTARRGLSRSQNLNSRDDWWGLPCPWKRSALASSYAEQTLPLEDFLSVRHRHQDLGPGFNYLMSRIPPELLFLGFPMGRREASTLFLAIRCVADASITAESVARLTAAGDQGPAYNTCDFVKPSIPKAQPFSPSAFAVPKKMNIQDD